MSVPANAERAASADAALMAYITRTCTDCDVCLADLLADLMHWADKCALCFEEELERARNYYAEEAAEETGDDDG